MKLRIHPVAFLAAAGTTESRSIEGARLMLVEGWTCLAASKHLGISHQAINKVSTRIAKQALAGPLCPVCGKAK